MPTFVHDPRDLIQIDEAWRVDHVGPGVAVGDEARDRVVEVVDAADVVLGPRGQHERLDIRVRRPPRPRRLARTATSSESMPSAAGS